MWRVLCNMGEKCGFSVPLNKPLSAKLRTESILIALVSEARSYDRAPSNEELREAAQILQKSTFSSDDFYAVCKAIYCLSYEREIEVNGTVYFWNSKKGLSITEENDMRLWI